MKKFRKLVYSYYAKYARNSLPWRNTRDPYRILVSEIMLQQTQVSRVLEKYKAFIREFPSLRALAQAPLGAVLKAWQGLGYNRRALALKETAEKVISEFKGKIPRERQALEALPGIGGATSGALCAFTFNQPVVFIETNIRSVFIHHFFRDARDISDARLLPYMEKALDRKNPRQWYYALMDYGVYLKGHTVNPARKSLHYRKQSPFLGSNRQLRGRVLKELLAQKRISVAKFPRLLNTDAPRINMVLKALCEERLITKKGRFFSIQA